MNKRSALAEFCDENKNVKYTENSSDSIMSKVITYIWNKKFNEAAKILEEEKEKEPNNIYIEKYIGIIKENLKKYSEAVKHYNEAIKLAKIDEELYDSFIKEMTEKIKHLNF